MSLTVNGRLFIQTKTGKYGPFNVGKLVTDVGTFAVKDKAFEEFEAGAYSGAFVIGCFYNHTVKLPSGATLIELRARIDDYSLLGDGEVPDDVVVAAEEPDPIDEELESVQPTTEAAGTKSDDAGDPPRSEEEKLFDELWPLTDVVKLDSTDRPKIRKQKEYLQGQGYTYNPTARQWELKEE